MRVKSQKKLTSVRRFLGARMAQSLRDIPQLTGMFDLDTTKLGALKNDLKAQNPNVTMTSLIVKLMAGVLEEYPLINSAVVGEELVIYDSVNIGVAVGLEPGILIAVIKEAQDKDIFVISDQLKDMTGRIKENTLPLAEMKGSTFTISSIGVQGFRYSTVVINPPESAMLAIGVTEPRVFLENGNVLTRDITSFSISHNHTVLDGYHVGTMVGLMKRRLEDPRAYMGLG